MSNLKIMAYKNHNIKHNLIQFGYLLNTDIAFKGKLFWQNKIFHHWNLGNNNKKLSKIHDKSMIYARKKSWYKINMNRYWIFNIFHWNFSKLTIQNHFHKDNFKATLYVFADMSVLTDIRFSWNYSPVFRGFFFLKTAY